jgi:hypothetical protein
VHPTYPQHRTVNFVSHLSIFDLLLNMGPESRQFFLTEKTEEPLIKPLA